jgi:hypothetical protein
MAAGLSDWPGGLRGSDWEAGSFQCEGEWGRQLKTRPGGDDERYGVIATDWVTEEGDQSEFPVNQQV